MAIYVADSGWVPAEWLRPGAPLVLEDTPTRLGPVSLRVEVEGGETRVDVRWPGEGCGPAGSCCTWSAWAPPPWW